MSYKTHAMREFKAAGWLNEDGSFKCETQKMMCDQIIELLDLFSTHGHSGHSAPYAINLFTALAKFEPIVPIQGTDDEWNEVGDGIFQNNRCSHVFKQADRFGGQAYDTEAVIFYDWYKGEDGEPYKSHYTCADSMRPVVFPYTPSRKYEERPSV